MNTGSLLSRYQRADIITKIIVINGVIFLFATIIAALFKTQPYNLLAWFVLPDDLLSFITQPWSLVTYSFIHFGFFHLLFNMLWFYFFGRYVLNLFSEKRLLSIYLLGAIVGGLIYTLSYNLFPAFTGINGYLIGASGAIMAVMAFAATYQPNNEVRIFTFTLKLWHIAVALIVWDLIKLGTLANAGGIFAHLGGAFLGYWYAKQLLVGKNIGAWFEDLLDKIALIFKPTKKNNFKKVHKNTTTQYQKKRSVNNETKTDTQQKIDAILDKISKSGYDSLSKAEKDFLFKAGKED